MANLYFVYAPSDAHFAGRLKQALESGEYEHNILPDGQSAQIEKADRVIFIRSMASITDHRCIADLELSLAKPYRTINVNWENISKDKLASSATPLDQRVDDETALKYDQRLVEIQWVNFSDTNKANANANANTHLNLHHSADASTNDSADDSAFFAPLPKLREAIGRDDPPYVAFISYTGAIRPMVYQIVNTLEQQQWIGSTKFSLWFDRHDIRPAIPWLKALETGIEDSHHFVCLITTEWLVSWACNHEFTYAYQLKKRIIPVYLEALPPDEQIIAAAQKRRSRAASGANAETIEFTIKAVLNHLREQQIEQRALHDTADIAEQVRPLCKTRNDGKPVGDALLLPYSGRLGDIILKATTPADDADLQYLVQHTEYLLDARRWNEKNRSKALLPHDDARRRLGRWIRIKTERYPQPNGIQQAYFAAAQKLYLRRRNRIVAIVSVIASVLILVGIFAVILTIQQGQNALQAQQLIDTENRMQTLAQLNRRRLYPNGQGVRAARPALGEQALWVSDQAQGAVLRLALQSGDQIGDPVSVGGEPLTPILDGADVWVSASGGSTITRLRAGDASPTSFTVGANPHQPVISEDAAYVLAAPGRTLYRIDKGSGIVTNTHFIDPNASEPIVGGGFVWMLLPDDQQLVQLAPDLSIVRTYSLADRPGGALFAADALYLSVGAVLEQIEPQTGTETTLYRADAALDPPVFVDNTLWVAVPQQNAIVQIGLDGSVQQTFSAGIQPYKFYVTPTVVWVLTRSDEIIRFNRATGAVLSHTALERASQVADIVDDGTHLWLTNTQESRVSLIDRVTGTVFREFSPCAQPLAPVFDGANMWFACRGDARLVSIPAEMAFFDTHNFVRDDQTQTPVVANNWLWTVQEDAGRIVVFDGTHQVGALDLQPGLIPLVQSNDYLYTAYYDGTKGHLIQIDPALLGIGKVWREIPLEGEIFVIKPIDGNIWITHSNIAEMDQDVNLTVLSEQTLEPVNRPTQLGFIPMGVQPIGDDVWVGAAKITSAAAYRFDAKTATQIGDPYDIPGTDFGSWSPVAIGNTAWFTASAPIIADIVGIVMQQKTPSFLYPLDLTNYTWGKPITLPSLVSAPQWDGRYFWYSQIDFGVVSAREQVTNSSGVIAVDPTTGAIFGPWKPCESLTNIYLAGNYTYVGCLQEPTMLVINTADLTQQQVNEVGVNPNPPVEHDGYVWFTYKDSGSAAAFDQKTGRLARVFRVGASPQAPVVYGDRVWVFNSGDGSLQQLGMPDDAAATE